MLKLLSVLMVLSSPCNAGPVKIFRDTYVKRKQQFKDDTPLAMPEGILQPGETTWDGVSVVLGQVDDC